MGSDRFVLKGAPPVLKARIDALQAQLSEVAGRLDLAPAQVDSALLDRVRIRFHTVIDQHRQELSALRRDVDKGRPLDACWDRLRLVEGRCRQVFAECLAFLEGALARQAGLDLGLCRIADALLDELSYLTDVAWDRFTILAEGEFVAEMADIIRLRFPETSLWNLPVAAHEFGHFLGPGIEVRRGSTRSRPFQDLLERERARGETAWHHLHEHFADLFATYAVGPAYAYTCVLLRFDPGRAYEDEPQHPSAARRVHWILRTLQKMDGSVQGAVPYLRDLWRQNLKAAGQPEALSPDAVAPLDVLLDEVFVQILPHVAEARYTGWARAQTLAATLLDDTQWNRPTTLEASDRLPDVLNAAWLCRIQRWEDRSAVQRVEARALELCRALGERVTRSVR